MPIDICYWKFLSNVKDGNEFIDYLMIYFACKRKHTKGNVIQN